MGGPARALVVRQEHGHQLVQPASLAGIGAQATLTAGTWPGPPHPGGPVPVALPAAAASQLHVTLGSVLTGTPRSGGAPTSLQVTGLFRPTNPASTYWALDLLPISGINDQIYTIGGPGPGPGSVRISSDSYGPAVVNPAAFGGALTVSQGSWMVLPQAPAHGPRKPRGAQRRHQRGGFATERAPP